MGLGEEERELKKNPTKGRYDDERFDVSVDTLYDSILVDSPGCLGVSRREVERQQ